MPALCSRPGANLALLAILPRTRAGRLTAVPGAIGRVYSCTAKHANVVLRAPSPLCGDVATCYGGCLPVQASAAWLGWGVLSHFVSWGGVLSIFCQPPWTNKMELYTVQISAPGGFEGRGLGRGLNRTRLRMLALRRLSDRPRSPQA